MTALTYKGKTTSIQKGDMVAYDINSRCLVFLRPNGHMGNVLEINNNDKLHFPMHPEDIPSSLLSIVRLISAMNHGLAYEVCTNTSYQHAYIFK